MNKRKVFYFFAWIMRCIDLGRDRAWNRFLSPFLTAITISTWLKVYFPDIKILSGLFIIGVIALLTIFFWFIFGFIWQKKFLQLENDFDMYRNPMMVEIIETLKRMERKQKK